MLLAGCASWGAPRRLQTAQTAEQEATEFRRIAASPELYTIEFLDSRGRPLGFDRGEAFSKVATIRIEWPNGITATHEVIEPANIRLLMVE
jgi:hypothetical protein